MSNRINRINGRGKRSLAKLYASLKTPELKNGLISVVAADVSKDLGKCVAFVSVMGSEKVQQDAIDGLHSASGFVRRELAKPSKTPRRARNFL